MMRPGLALAALLLSVARGRRHAPPDSLLDASVAAEGRSSEAFPVVPVLAPLLATAPSAGFCGIKGLARLPLAPPQPGTRVRRVQLGSTVVDREEVEEEGRASDRDDDISETAARLQARFERDVDKSERGYDVDEIAAKLQAQFERDELRVDFERLAPDGGSISKDDLAELRARYEKLVPEEFGDVNGVHEEKDWTSDVSELEEIDEAIGIDKLGDRDMVSPKGARSMKKTEESPEQHLEASELKFWRFARDLYHKTHGHEGPRESVGHYIRAQYPKAEDKGIDVHDRRKRWAAKSLGFHREQQAVAELNHKKHVTRREPEPARLDEEKPIMMPTHWTKNLGSIEVWDDWTPRVMRHGYPDVYHEGRARYAFDPSIEFAFSMRRVMAPETRRDLRARRMLSPSGCTPAVLESFQCSNMHYELTESPGNVTLEHLVRHYIGVHKENGPVVPLEQSLPMMMDMLRGLESMESHGIVFGNLNERSIFVFPAGESFRALYTDFRETCSMTSDDKRWDCRAGWNPAGTGTTYRHAPEMTDDRPTGTANNVWQLGLIFARMIFGGDIPTLDEAERTGLSAVADESTRSGKEEIQKFIKDSFSIRHDPAFKRLEPEYGDLLEVVEGMLEKRPSRRWSPAEALEGIEKAAEKRNLPVLPRRKPKGLPGEWTAY